MTCRRREARTRKSDAIFFLMVANYGASHSAFGVAVRESALDVARKEHFRPTRCDAGARAPPSIRKTRFSPSGIAKRVELEPSFGKWSVAALPSKPANRQLFGACPAID